MSAEDQRKAAATYVGARYSVQVCNAQRTMAQADCDPARDIFLAADYYKGDRAMRESGFDISFRFGPYGAATHHYAPVCLNSLLYKTEKDLEPMAKRWAIAPMPALGQQASQRSRTHTQYLWDAKKGMFFDYNFNTIVALHLRLRDDVLPALDRHRHQGRSRSRAAEPSAFEHPGGLGHERQRPGRPVGLPLWMGPHAIDWPSQACAITVSTKPRIAHLMNFSQPLPRTSGGTALFARNTT